jgi:hypothetical protein
MTISALHDYTVYHSTDYNNGNSTNRYANDHTLGFKGRVQSVCKQSLCLHFGIQNIEIYSTTIYIFMLLQYNKLSRYNNQALQEHKMK